MFRTSKAVALAALMTILATNAFAQAQMVGKEAPAFDAKACVNPPEATTMEQCAAEVVLIKYWGTK